MFKLRLVLALTIHAIHFFRKSLRIKFCIYYGKIMSNIAMCKQQHGVRDNQIFIDNINEDKLGLSWAKLKLS